MKTFTLNLAYIESIETTELKSMLKTLNSLEEFTPSQSSARANIIVELEERVERDARDEFKETHSQDIIDFIKNLKGTTMNSTTRIQYNVAVDTLIERHPAQAKRADAYCGRNEHLNWDNAFFALIADIENH